MRILIAFLIDARTMFPLHSFYRSSVNKDEYKKNGNGVPVRLKQCRPSPQSSRKSGSGSG